MTSAQAEQAVEYVNVDVEAGIIIQSLMFRHREKQADLAPVCGVSQSTLSKKLRGSVSFSLAELMRIARHYEVEAGELLPRLDSNQQPCGYRSEQVTDSVTDDRWALLFDEYAAAGAWALWCSSTTVGPGSTRPDVDRAWSELVKLADRWV